MTARIFTLIMIALSLTGLTAIFFVALIRGYVVEFIWKVGFVLSHVCGGIADLFCQTWIDISNSFRKKSKAVQLDEHEKNIS